MKLVLEVIEDGKRSLYREIEDRPHIIGRDLTADIPVSREAFSRRHAIFLPYQSGWAIIDLDSTNGSWINGAKLQGMTLHALKDSDYIQLADLAFKVRCYQKENETIATNGFRLFALRGETETVELDPSAFDGSIVTEFGIAFEMRNSAFYLEIEDGNAVVLKNRERVALSTQVIAGDVITCQDFQFLVVFGSLCIPFQDRNKKVAGVEKAKIALDLTGPDRASSEPTVYGTDRTTMIEPERFTKLKFGESGIDDNHNDDDDVHYATAHKRTEIAWTAQGLLAFFEDLNEAERRLLYGIVFFIGASLFLFFIWLLFLR